MADSHVRVAVEIRICISENSFQDVNDIVVKRVGFASEATFNKAQPLKVRQRANLRQRFASARPMVLDCEAHYPSSWKAILSFLEKIGSVPKTLFKRAKTAKVNICKRPDLMTETVGKVKEMEREVGRLQKTIKIYGRPSTY